MAEIWKTEYAVKTKDGQAFDWYPDKAGAVASAKDAAAEAPGIVYEVEAITSYLDDRKVVFSTAPEDADDDA